MYDVRPVRASVLLALCLVSFTTHAADAPRAVRDAPEPPAADVHDAAAEQARSLAIERLEALLRGAELGREQRAELLFRLAELTWEQGRAAQLRAMAEATAAFDACQAAGGPCVFEEPSKAWLERPIALYARILADYPEYARIDEVTWASGRALFEAGRVAEANTQLTRLVKTWPASGYVTDAYVLIGEYWFDRGEVYKATTAYGRAAADRAHAKSLYARYKLAWCRYNLGEPEAALDDLRAVLADAADAPGSGDAARISLRDEALGDVVRFAAEAGVQDLAPLLGGRVRPDELVTLRDKLAERFFELGRRDAAAAGWRHLLAEHPTNPAAPRWAEGAVRVALDAGRLADALTGIEALDAGFGPGSAWARANAARPDEVAAVDTRVEALLAGLATRAHREAKATPALADVAARAYARALERFPAGPNAYELRYGYAELLYRRGAFDEAYAQYIAVVEMDPAGKHARFCAESAVFAARERAKAERVTLAGKERVPLGPWEQKELAAIERYVALGGPKTQEMRFEAAAILQGKNHLREASAIFRSIVEAEPTSALAERAAAGMLDGLAVAEEWDALADTALLLARSPDIGTEAFRREARDIGERASFKRVEARFARDGDPAAAAAGFLAFADAFPTSAVADLALNNAAAYLDDRDVRGALAARERLVAGYPKSRHRAAAMAALGYGYESLADFARAAEWYERFTTEAPTHPDAPAALWSAGLFRATTGAWQAAVADWQRYATTWPDRADAPGVALQVGPLLAEHGKVAEAAALYKRFYEAPPRGAQVDQVLFARLAYGELLDDLGQAARAPRHWEESLAWAAAAEARGPLPEAAPEYVARMRIAATEPALDAYLALAIDGAGARGRAATDAALEAQLLAKARGVKALEEAYASVLRPGVGASGFVALAKLGAAYEDFAATLRASYVPDYLTEEQRWLYTQRVADLAYAQEERAAATYRTLLARASELDTFDATTEEVATRLAALRPEETPPRAERTPEPRFFAAATYRAGFEE